MERKAQAELEGRGDDRAPKHKSSGNASIDTINTMQIRMLKADASPMKKKLAKACSQGMQHTGFDVWLHVYDLGPISQWMNSLSAKESNLGANEICNVLARLERDWPARSYHFLSHNCTDF